MEPIVVENHSLSDADVVARVLAGETALFEILMHLSAYLHLAQFAGDAQFATWLTRIAIHEALARTRQRTRRAEIDLEEQEQMNRLVSDRRSPEEQTADRELSALLEAAVDALPDLYRVVFMMREVQQLSTAETAACLEVTEETVKVRLHRAKGMLREAMFARAEAGASKAYPFLGARCDRLVEAVMSRIGAQPGRGS